MKRFAPIEFYLPKLPQQFVDSFVPVVELSL